MRTKDAIRVVWMILVVVMLASLSGTLPAAAQSSQEAGRRAQWNVKYAGGSRDLGRGTKLRLTVQGGQIECAAEERVVLSIPVASLTQVTSTNASGEHPLMAGLKTGGRVTRAIERGDPSGGYMTVYYLVFGFVPTMGISALVHSKKHYQVNLAWEEDSSTQEASFLLGPGEYSTFLSELQQASGKPWIDLRVEEGRLKREKDNRASVWLSSSVRIADTDLKPGLYQLVWLDHQGTPDNLYFFEGSGVNLRHIAASVPVEVLPAPENVSDPPLTYRERDGVNALTEIRLQKKMLRLRSGSPAASKSAPEVTQP